MSIPTQDLTSGVDFATVNPVEQTDLNQGLATLVPTAVTIQEVEGIGFVITTIDTAEDTPTVPDPEGADIQNKWKRYIWNRIPHSSAVDQRAKTYCWIDTAASDATLLKWNFTYTDLTDINTEISDLQTGLNNATVTVNAAANNASAALTTAQAAQTTANNAANNISAAQDAATAAANSAAQANTTANSAATSAAAALAAANAAVSSAAGNKNVNQINPGSSGQKIKTNAAGTANVYYNHKDNIVSYVESVNAGNDSAQFNAGANGWNDRTLNTLLNSGNGEAASTPLITVINNTTFKLSVGIYKVSIKCPHSSTNATRLSRVVASRLYNKTDNAVLLMGTTSNTTQGYTFVDGIVTITDATKTLAVQTFVGDTGGGGTFGQWSGGTSAGVGSPGSPIYYTTMTLEKLD